MSLETFIEAMIYLKIQSINHKKIIINIFKATSMLIHYYIAYIDILLNTVYSEEK